MSRKMLINASEPEEIRVAIVEGSILEEYYVERLSVESVLGNIYKGRVTNVEPSIGAAFVEFGGARHGFLHVSDVMETSLALEAGDAAPVARPEPAGRRRRRRGGDEEEGAAESATAPPATAAETDDEDADGAPAADEARDDVRAAADAPEAAAEDDVEDIAPQEEEDEEEPATDDREPDEAPAGGRGGRRGRRGRGRAGMPPASASRTAPATEASPEKRGRNRSVADYLKKGQEVVAQVTKDGIGTKGPTLTTYLSLPGRYLVLMPGLDRKGVSRKIDDPKERDRLKKVLDQLDVRDGLGFIVRTAGIGQTARALQKDYRYLTKLWDRVVENAQGGDAPALLYRESDLVIRTIRDVYGPDMGDIIIDDEECARRAREFLAMVMPRAVNRVKLYTGERPLFSAYGVEEEIGRLFMHRVELPSGGSLIIEQTEALVAIDVNSGRFRDEEDLEETAYKINVEAAEAITRQLRLRDLGGVIVVDFIDMRSEKRRRAVERAFKNALRNDRARIKVARMSPFGTIELTRQRVRPSLRHSIFHRCPNCRGAGYVATPETLELNLVRQIKLLLARRNSGLEVFLNQDNLEYLLNEKRERILELERSSQKPIRLRVEPELRNDEFRVVPLNGH